MNKKILLTLGLALVLPGVVLIPGSLSVTSSKIMPSVQCLLSRPDLEKVKIWVYFKDHGERFDADLQRTFQNVQLSERALRRRMNRAGSPVVDVTDLPVSRAYINDLVSSGLRIRRVSKYLNAVSAEATPEQVRQVSNLPFISKIDRVFTLRRRPPADSGKETVFPSERTGPMSRSEPAWGMRAASALSYGPSRRQLEQINVLPLHESNYHGEGVLVAMLDTGFNRSHQALDHLDVVAEWDFIFGDSVTHNQPGDSWDQHNHGTQTLATLGGYEPGQLIGPAWAASFILAKTERKFEEVEAEEDDYVRALEWAESLGADVVSSSLGYYDWYDYSNLDGNTAVTTIAADIAAAKGVTVVTAAGNQGPLPWPGLIAPADGDSVIAVGAVDSTGIIASFSSRGPTYDGRIKPDVMAMGMAVATVSPNDSLLYTRSQGTSFSTPLVAGAVALLLQMHPNWGPIEVRNALRSEASNSSSPNNDYGWGIIDAYSSALSGATGVLEGVQLSPVYQNGRVRISIQEPGGSGVVLTLERQDFDTAEQQDWSDYRTLRDDIYIDSSTSVVHEENLPSGVYRYRVFLTADPTVASDHAMVKVPFALRLGQSYPNPFVQGRSSELRIPYSVGGNPSGPHEEIAIEELKEVSLVIYDATGARVRVLKDELQAPGSHIASWNGRDERAVLVASGVYYYRLSAGGQPATRKLVFLR